MCGMALSCSPYPVENEMAPKLLPGALMVDVRFVHALLRCCLHAVVVVTRRY
jgi:hypothetical protein